MTSPAPGPAAVVGACEIVWVDGPDAASFLQGLVTNDVAALPIGSACHALVLDSTGHLRADLRVARTAQDGFTLVSDGGQGDRIAALLDEYHFSEDIDIVGPEPFAMVTLIGADAPAGADLVLPGRIPDTTDAITADAPALLVAAGASELPPDALEARRIAAGVPRFGVDVTTAHLVQEAGLETSAVSFEKGCYLGQETVARVHYRGQVNRRLVGVALSAAAPTGTPVTVDGREVGILTSVAASPELGEIGLAVIRREAPAGTTVDVGETAPGSHIVELPFTTLTIRA